MKTSRLLRLGLAAGMVTGVGCTVDTAREGVAEETAAPQSGASPSGARDDQDPRVLALAREVRSKGWVVYSAHTDEGDWDLFLTRPDGSAQRQLTKTSEYNEGGARFSPDGRRLLYYRMPKSVVVDNNQYGRFELVIADSDGRNPVVYGKDYNWASWGPNGEQIAHLTRTGIQIVDLSTKRTIRTLAKRGMFHQIFLSPDGRWLTGTANGLGEHWAIGRMDVSTGNVSSMSDPRCFNCTSDWFPDSRHIIYSKGIPCTGEWAQLWMTTDNPPEGRLIYAESTRHIYGGAASPDGRYVVFTRSQRDLGRVDHSGTTMALIRLQDSPIIRGDDRALRNAFPDTKDGPVLDLFVGWEPHWTYADIGGDE
ncbi:MAG: hypothetical protein ACRD2X_27135 [Vicinamibacteraceae bacterium]